MKLVPLTRSLIFGAGVGGIVYAYNESAQKGLFGYHMIHLTSGSPHTSLFLSTFSGAVAAKTLHTLHDRIFFRRAFSLLVSGPAIAGVLALSTHFSLLKLKTRNTS